MKKKYICRLSGSNILVRVHGAVKRLEFEPDVINQYGLLGCSYSTDDATIQSAVENHPQFRNGQRNGITIYGESFEPVKHEPTPVPVVEKRVVRISKKKKEV